jgi:hypothetical protein
VIFFRITGGFLDAFAGSKIAAVGSLKLVTEKITHLITNFQVASKFVFFDFSTARHQKILKMRAYSDVPLYYTKLIFPLMNQSL